MVLHGWLYLEPSIVSELDEFINKYVSNPRGRVINLIVSLFLLLDKKTQRHFEQRANQYIDSSTEISYGTKYGEKRKGKIEMQLFISHALNEKFDEYNDKVLIIASLLYVGILKDKEGD